MKIEGMTDIERMINCHRKMGNTEWILKAAIHNPNVAIVCKSLIHRSNMMNDYKKLLKKVGLIQKLKWFFCGRVDPKFIIVGRNQTIGIKTPIVFDNFTIQRFLIMETITCKVNKKEYELVPQTEKDLELKGNYPSCKGCAAYKPGKDKVELSVDHRLCKGLGTKCIFTDNVDKVWKEKK